MIQVFHLVSLVGKDFKDSFFSIFGRCLPNFGLKASSDRASGGHFLRQPAPLVSPCWC